MTPFFGPAAVPLQEQKIRLQSQARIASAKISRPRVRTPRGVPAHQERTRREQQLPRAADREKPAYAAPMPGHLRYLVACGDRQTVRPRARRNARFRLVLLAFLLCVSGLIGAAPSGWAHPLGNFTVNTHIGLRVEPAAVAITVVLDIAEVPTLRTFPALGDSDGVPDAEQAAYQARTCRAVLDGVLLELDGRALELVVVDSSLTFPTGDAGLPTTRLVCALRTTAALDTVGHQLVLIDTMAVEPVGWREVTAIGDGVELAASTVAERSVSDVLRSYPEDLLDDPLDQRGATVSVLRGSGVVTGGGPLGDSGSRVASPRGVDWLTTEFTDLVASTRLTLGFGILAMAIAIVLGALHAVAPGHGKALMAAYLVGRNGSLRQAALIAISVTATHTVGVLLLGVLLSAAVVAAPERVYPWLGVVGGALVVAIGMSLLRSAWRRHDPGPRRRSDPGPTPANHRTVQVVQRASVGVGTLSRSGADTTHTHGGHTHEHRVATDPRSLLAVGFAGGLVPSPSALVVLLGGIALGRAWFGVLLVLAYGIGMALTLVGTGFVLMRARIRIERWSATRARDGRHTPGVLAVSRRLPVITAATVVVIGLVLTGQSLTRL